MSDNEISPEVKKAVEGLRIICGNDLTPEELIEDAKLFVEDAKNFTIAGTPELDKYFIKKFKKLQIK